MQKLILIILGVTLVAAWATVKIVNIPQDSNPQESTIPSPTTSRAAANLELEPISYPQVLSVEDDLAPSNNPMSEDPLDKTTTLDETNDNSVVLNSPTPLPTITITGSLEDAINNTRNNTGLNSLSTNDVACDIATQRLAQAKANLSHQGLSWFMQKYNIGIGETISQGYTTEASAFNAWMNSPVHRTTILNAAWKHLCLSGSGDLLIAIFTT
ncbi:CAP domain-containing protein [candidate division WWE3 bacterium]|uniref:CAP domain-containing protein n=1 Tax=candidate division WWE3 bacterium TaxID=2053526 RepID=A0A955LJS3_UNCKA|nr:CAP domain-containing protein [candidate division WWE3 bacterium]